MARTPKKPQQPAAPASGQQPPVTRRGRARWQRERQRQRITIITTGAAIGLALLAVLVGVLYDRVWLPSQPVVQVNGTTLNRGAYETERRNDIARRITQNLQLLTLFGGQFSSQFAGQTPALDSQVASIGSSPVDEETASNWIDSQLIQQGANELKLQADDGEIAQVLVGELITAFPAPQPPPTSTTTMTPTAIVTNATTLPTTAANQTAAPTISAAGTTPPAASTAESSAATTTSDVTATEGPTGTPLPTVPPTATPLADVALREQENVLDRLFNAYVQEIQNADSTRRPALKRDDFKAALHDQYLRQVLTNKIEAQLLPETSFQPSTEPSSITTRHILIKVTTPLSETDSVRDAAYAQRKPEAEALLAQLRAGTDFATLAKEHSEDLSTKDNGGELPPFDKDGRTQQGSAFDPAFVTAARALKENEISDLVRTPFGWHIIQVVKITIDPKSDQLQAARTKAFDKWLADKRTAANVQRYPPVTPTPTSEPTPTGGPFPTVPLGGEPTEVPTTTATLTGTTTLTSTATLAGTATPTATTIQAAPTTPTTIPGTPAPVAVPATPAATPKP